MRILPLLTSALLMPLASGLSQDADSRGSLDPYRDAEVAAAARARITPVIYTPQNAPPPAAETDLPSVASISQHGITWHFDKPARTGRFVNGDHWVLGPVTIVRITPEPIYGRDVPESELDPIELKRRPEHRVRNGFMVNPPAAMQVAYDSGVRNFFEPALVRQLPVTLQPGDALVSTISMPKGLRLQAQLRNTIERGKGDGSPVRTAAILTSVPAIPPPDAFRPAFCDRSGRTYRARDLRRELLPLLKRPRNTPSVERFTRFFERPWVGTGFFGFEAPVENMPQYGREYGRVVGMAALLLCLDLKPAEREALLIRFVQAGIDLGGMVRAGHPGWTAWGGHGSGRKLPIVVAGLLLGDEELANVTRHYPTVSFGEDEQTAYGECWTGAKVVFAGHSGIDTASGVGRNRSRGAEWGPYEHLPPTEWKEGQNTSEAYRRCCTSIAWVAQALALRLMRAESNWNHPPFFDYVDRWMYEDDAVFVEAIRTATGKDHSAAWARQGQSWDTFVDDLWRQHRRALPAPLDGWKQSHDDTRYQNAVQQMNAGK